MEIKKNNEPEEIYTKTLLENTPFLIIHNPEKKIAFGVFGQYKITKDFDNPDDVKNELLNITWENIINVMACIYEMLKYQEVNRLNSKTE